MIVFISHSSFMSRRMIVFTSPFKFHVAHVTAALIVFTSPFKFHVTRVVVAFVLVCSPCCVVSCCVVFGIFDASPQRRSCPCSVDTSPL